MLFKKLLAFNETRRSTAVHTRRILSLNYILNQMSSLPVRKINIRFDTIFHLYIGLTGSPDPLDLPTTIFHLSSFEISIHECWISIIIYSLTRDFLKTKWNPYFSSSGKRISLMAIINSTIRIYRCQCSSPSLSVPSWLLRTLHTDNAGN
jgi:hypothetical protein